MIKVSVLYPNEQGKRFDMDYFMNKHMPLAERLLGPTGLVRSEVEKGVGSGDPNTPAPFTVTAHFLFNSLEEVHSAFTAHAGEIMGDTPNYTDIQPQIQIGEVIK